MPFFYSFVLRKSQKFSFHELNVCDFLCAKHAKHTNSRHYTYIHIMCCLASKNIFQIFCFLFCIYRRCWLALLLLLSFISSKTIFTSIIYILCSLMWKNNELFHIFGVWAFLLFNSVFQFLFFPHGYNTTASYVAVVHGALLSSCSFICLILNRFSSLLSYFFVHRAVVKLYADCRSILLVIHSAHFFGSHHLFYWFWYMNNDRHKQFIIQLNFCSIQVFGFLRFRCVFYLWWWYIVDVEKLLFSYIFHVLDLYLDQMQVYVWVCYFKLYRLLTSKRSVHVIKLIILVVYRQKSMSSQVQQMSFILLTYNLFIWNQT